ncbi:sensor histidine kinase [Gillisia hiemivivida]|uniref:Histidine kinase n=1 Tax=Gillisia hiemivivida TaxID=291190 RepID=A0A5C6ZUQ5_9FLAO|nr:histidine kinase [Gillisia hiemivivida]TXD94121.1 histidine kinase [Gillisia hiemivivida]
MLVNKKKRIKYIGFNDFWFSVIGVLIISFVTAYLSNYSNEVLSFVEAAFSWGFSLFLGIIYWLILRATMIFLRKKYPDFRDDAKRNALFFLAIVCTVFLVDFIGRTLISLIPGVNYVDGAPRIKMLLISILITTMIMAIYEAIYYNIRLKNSVREEEQSKQAVVQAQLDALRNQAQPHFFFNTLNTLRDIIDQNSKENATEFVDKLSDMYRFLLESGNANLITLRDELKFSKAYIHIQSERFGDNLKLNWNIPKASLDAMIVPMSLQLLLENAIKHNVISKAKPLEVHINIKDDSIIVDNRIQVKSTQLPSIKVGLKNIEKRYALITSKSVDIQNDGNQFSVSLPLLKTSEQKNSHENINN